MKTSEMINEIAKAMSLAQSQMTPASTDSTNPHFRSKYANLESVIDAFRIPLCSNGLAFWQDVTTTESQVMISTRIIHSSGQWVEFGPLCIPVGKKDAHGIGSATTYGKRYALCAAMGVAPGEIDDDASGAVASVHGHVPGSHVEKPKTKVVETPKPSYLENCIVQGQVETIQKLIEQCEEGYVTKLNKHLLDSGWPTYAHIPQDKYNIIITGINKNIEINKKNNG